MPCAEASIVVSATGTPSRDTRTAAYPFASTHASVTPFQKCAAAAMNFATRSRPTTGTRAARTIPPPSEVETTSSAKRPPKAAMSAFCAAAIKASRRRSCSLELTGVRRIPDMFTGTGDELADVCFLHFQDVRDLAVGVVECFTQNIRGAFAGRKFLKKQQGGPEGIEPST
jgi:hypothetical protein